MKDSNKVLPHASLIVARTFHKGVIGRYNTLPWRLRTDLLRFKDLTMGRAVIMGRQTFLSLKKPLSGRLNIVISRILAQELGKKEEDSLFYVPTYEAAVEIAQAHALAHHQDDYFIIGGEALYDYVVRRDLVDRMYITEVLAYVDGDRYFKYRPDPETWDMISSSTFEGRRGVDEYSSTFVVWQHKRVKAQASSSSGSSSHKARKKGRPKKEL